jgi:hypothetical protein
MGLPAGSRRNLPSRFYCVGCEKWFAGFWEFKRHQDSCRPVADLTDDQSEDGGGGDG